MSWRKWLFARWMEVRRIKLLAPYQASVKNLLTQQGMVMPVRKRKEQPMTLRQAQHLALDEARGDDVRIVVLSRGYGTCGGRPLEVALDIGAGRRLKWTPPEQLVLKEVNSKKR